MFFFFFFRLTQQLILIKEKPHMKFKVQHFGYNSYRKTSPPFSMNLLNWLHGRESKFSLQYSPLNRIQALKIYRENHVWSDIDYLEYGFVVFRSNTSWKETYLGQGEERILTTTHLNGTTYMTLVNNKACTTCTFIKNSKEIQWTELDFIFHFMQKGVRYLKATQIFHPNRNTKSEL